MEKESTDLKSINQILINKNSSPLKQKVKLKTVLSRPHITIYDLFKDPNIEKKLKGFSSEAIEQAEIEIKYGGYLNKEKKTANKLTRLENIKIPLDFEYEKLHSMSTEGKEKLKSIQPNTIGQATRISGVSPSDINVLLIYLGR